MGGGDRDSDIKGFKKIPEDDEIRINLARAFNTAQHQESWKEAIRNNPKALGWCMYSVLMVWRLGD